MKFLCWWCSILYAICGIILFFVNTTGMWISIGCSIGCLLMLFSEHHSEQRMARQKRSTE